MRKSKRCVKCAERRTGRSDQNNVLSTLMSEHRLRTDLGDLRLLDGNWYVTHSGLLRIAQQNRCSGIHTEVVPEFSDASCSRWVVRAIVYKSPRSKGFVGYGDANPTNVSSLVRGAELRLAETRAVNRALRKAYGIGLCSVEELGSTNGRIDSIGKRSSTPPPPPRPAIANDQRPHCGRPLRDRLFAIIRQYELDPALVKRYAVDFCGTESLRQASREQVEKFITHLAESAARSREELAQQLDRYKEKEKEAA